MVLEKKHEFSVWYILIALLVLFSFRGLLVNPTETLAYSDFKLLLEASMLEELTISDTDIRGTVLTTNLNQVLPADKVERLQSAGDNRRAFITLRVDDDNLIEVLEESGVTFTGRKENIWLGSIISTLVWFGLFFGIWIFAMRRMNTSGGLMSVGKSKAKVYVEQDTKITFDDVAGVDEAKEELQEVVNFLKNPEQYGRLGAHIPKGILLVGPPGTGKTLFARAIAGEAKVPFYSISGSEFVEMFVGVGAARVRDLFEQARLRAPAIIFIDELDALGRARGVQGLGGGHDEKEQTLNQLLVEMDGFDPRQGLILLAATNRPEILDPALLRAGRFDRQVLVDRPDKIGREAILRVHSKKVKLADKVNLEEVAALTPGFTGADLANLINEAALLATRREAEAVTLGDFTNAIERIVAGLEKKNRLLNPKEREVVAFHEMGHALVAMTLPGVDPVHKISIIPRGIGSLGYTIQRPTEDRFLMTYDELMNKMIVLLGGRASEFLVFQHFSTGAADDLAKATDIARSMVTRYGMDETLGHVVYQEEKPLFMDNQTGYPQHRDFSNETADKIDQAVHKLLQNAFEQAGNILRQNRDLLDKGARLLLEKETLSEAQLGELKASLPDSAAGSG